MSARTCKPRTEDAAHVRTAGMQHAGQQDDTGMSSMSAKQGIHPVYE